MKKIYSFLILFASFYGAAQTITIPDANFKAILLDGNRTFNHAGSQIYIDLNHDGEVQIEEALHVYSIDIDYTNTPMNHINTIEGIEKFTNLTQLNVSNQNITTLNLAGLNNLEYVFCGSNMLNSVNLNGLQKLNILNLSSNELSSIDFSTNPLLEDLSIGANKFSSINISNLAHLKKFSCYMNLITSLDMSGNAQLVQLNCSENNINSLNISGLMNMKKIEIQHNKMTTLDFSGFNNLQEIICFNNNLSSINVSGCSGLTSLFCYKNYLTTLDVSECPLLSELGAPSNQLEYVNIKNGSNLSFFSLGNNPGLSFVCIDENENPADITHITENYPNCVVSTNCSLSNPDFDFNRYITIYPNPAVTVVNLEVNGDIVIESLEVYNIMGQMVLTMPKANNTSAIDVASLASGSYILKIYSNKGTTNSKFIKKQ